MMNLHHIRRKHRPWSRCSGLFVANKQHDKNLPHQVKLMNESEPSMIDAGIGRALLHIGCTAMRVASPWLVLHSPTWLALDNGHFIYFTPFACSRLPGIRLRLNAHRSPSLSFLFLSLCFSFLFFLSRKIHRQAERKTERERE